ncbi:S1C family serine protease [Amphritea pacifica]|uniref:S1C family serine protease n=1 Tax=Amphritea pacifica TaxID=2811233 RepID=UPI001965C6A1|nr:serine protease [Amphritea pacifica]MBN1007233.1 trypsin-like peptidase domain-containing protein [Amphritea pacifica]
MRYLIIALALLLAGCEVAPVKDASSVQVATKLDNSLTLPVAAPLAYYISREDLQREVYGADGYSRWKFYPGPLFKKAAEIVYPDFFSVAGPLAEDQPFRYLVKLSSEAGYSNLWGTFKVTVTASYLDRQGSEVFKTTTDASVTGANLWQEAYTSIYAEALKESTHRFLNHMAGLNNDLQQPISDEERQTADFDKLLGEMKPAGNGTGFFINSTGQLLTAAHVVNECLKTEVRYHGQNYPANRVAVSRVLDLAVLQADLQPARFASIPANASDDVALGQSVFVTGYPLGSIMADYPSLTMGNISSLGGLKGALANLQFSAPVQPGNSGGPLIDYNGNAVGVVTSSLNQSMMLAKTGTTSQNVNFAVSAEYMRRFLDHSHVQYRYQPLKKSLETASDAAVKFTVQILCYQ